MISASSFVSAGVGGRGDGIPLGRGESIACTISMRNRERQRQRQRQRQRGRGKTERQREREKAETKAQSDRDSTCSSRFSSTLLCIKLGVVSSVPAPPAGCAAAVVRFLGVLDLPPSSPTETVTDRVRKVPAQRDRE